jgi:hypothetical protein
LEFVELDVGEGVLPKTEFTEELMDSDNDLEESKDDSSDNYHVEVAPPLEDERDVLYTCMWFIKEGLYYEPNEL